MEKYYGLSSIEYELMKLFWSSGSPVPFAEVMSYCKDVMKKDWAQTTLHTYLTRLIKKGILSSERKGYKRSYYAKINEQELSHIYAERFLKESYNGSVKNLLLSLTYKTKFSQSEVDELKQLLDAGVSDEETKDTQ